MKKYIYILSIAIAATLTGCTQWVEGDPLQWANGEVVVPPELTIEAPERITSDKLSFTAKVKNATNLAYVLVENSTVDYHELMYGYVPGVVKTSISNEGYEHTFVIEGAVAGKTYTLYVAVAEAHGLMSTFKKNIAAIDGVLPYITDKNQLTATINGTQANIAFNEPIVRNNNMGAIIYDVITVGVYGDYKVIKSGTASATANGNRLTVSLPEPATFDESVGILLSFEEGAVEDLHGNKMAAIANSLDDDGLPTGPWWNYKGFFRNGHNYAFAGKIDMGTGTRQQFSTTAMTLTHVADNVTIGEVTAKAWTLPSILNAFSTGVVTTNNAVPAYTYTGTVDGKKTGNITFHDIDNELPLLGTMTLGQNGIEQEVYAADYDKSAGKVYPGWYFAISNTLLQNQSFYCCKYQGIQPVIIAIDNDTREIMIVADIDHETFLLQDGDFVDRSFKANIHTTPVVLKNVKLEINRNNILRYTE